MPSRSASSRRSAARPRFNASAFYYDYEDYQAFVQLGYNQTVINLPATAYGLEAEINSHPVDGLTLQLGVSALSSNVEDIILPDSITEVEHDLPQAPELLGQRAGALRVRAGRRPRIGPGGRPVHGRFLLHGPVRPGREGKGIHRRERARRLRGRGRPLGGRGLRRQPHRKRNTACTRSTARCLRVSWPASTQSREPMECGRCTASAGHTEDDSVSGGVRMARAGKSVTQTDQPSTCTVAILAAG